MKEQIYTIPINDSFDDSDGCPVCRLADMLESETLDYVLSPAMMEPDVRRAMNVRGFCPAHYKALLALRKRLPLALILESRLQYLEDLSDFSEAVSGCYVCQRVGEFIDKMYSNIVYLWLSHPEFRHKFDKAELICLPHISALFKTARLEAGKKGYSLIAAALRNKAKTAIAALEAGVSDFSKSFDHRFSGVELEENKQALERAIEYLACVNILKGDYP